jgi:hypothetical protein
MPLWLGAQIKAGKVREDFLIAWGPNAAKRSNRGR